MRAVDEVNLLSMALFFYCRFYPYSFNIKFFYLIIVFTPVLFIANSGRGRKKQVNYDLTKITHNTKDPNPEGVTDFNPIKRNTSKGLIDYMSAQGNTPD